MPFCQECGVPIGETDKYCNECGTNMISQPSPTRYIVASPVSMKEAELVIPASIANSIPSMVKTQLALMSPDRQGQFVEEYRRKKKSIGMAYFLWFIIGLHYIYLGKGGTQFFYWITLGAMFIWTFIDIFRIPGMVGNYNKDVAMDVMRDIKIMTTPMVEPQVPLRRELFVPERSPIQSQPVPHVVTAPPRPSTPEPIVAELNQYQENLVTPTTPVPPLSSKTRPKAPIDVSYRWDIKTESPRRLWRDIERFITENGYKHRQLCVFSKSGTNGPDN